MLTGSGCVLQREDGSLRAVPAEAAAEFSRWEPARRALSEQEVSDAI